MDEKSLIGNKERRCMLPIEYAGGGMWRGQPQRPYRPLGLAIWNAPHGTNVAQCLIGANLQLVCAFGAVPARFFAQCESYADIGKQIDRGEDPPPAWCSWDPIEPGQYLRLQLTDYNGQPLVDRELIEIASWGVEYWR